MTSQAHEPAQQTLSYVKTTETAEVLWFIVDISVEDYMYGQFIYISP